MTANAINEIHVLPPFDVLVPSRQSTLFISLHTYYRFLLLSNKCSPFNRDAELAHLFICVEYVARTQNWELPLLSGKGSR